MPITQDTSGAKSTGPAPDSFVVTHCRQCAAGWSRTGTEGGVLTVCLLDREPVMPAMTGCDRYELREKPPA